MNILDLFSGIGGFSLGLERAGMRTAAFCEIDPHARKVLNKHWPDVPVFTDVSTLSKDDLNEQIDVIAGGFPCQDISTAGLGAGLSGSRSGLWFQFHRLIKEIQPRYAIIENVSALRSRGLDKVLWSLAEIGYDAEWHCIPASAVGAPHRRDRIWIVAYPRHRGRGNVWAFEGGENSQGEWPTNTSALNRPSSEPTFVANTQSVIRDERGRSEHSCAGEVQQPSGRTRSVLADTKCGGLQSGDEQIAHPTAILSGKICSDSREHNSKGIWRSEPNVGRVAHGVPNRAHRLKQLGNAVVPQIPELIGRAIMEYERVNSLG
jgi:DNA (cytosine-5)-methyltransferase 1